MHSLLRNNDEMPATLAELEKRLKLNRGKKANMWAQVAKDMSDQFHKLFTAKHVSRKWCTLVDGYKKAIANNGSTGRGTSRFRWLMEMGELIGDQHDVNFVATGTAQGVSIHRPEALQAGIAGKENNSEKDDADGSSAKSQIKTPRRKRKADNSSSADQLLEYLKHSDEKATALEEKMVSELSEIGNTMKALLAKCMEQT